MVAVQMVALAGVAPGLPVCGLLTVTPILQPASTTLPSPLKLSAMEVLRALRLAASLAPWRPGSGPRLLLLCVKNIMDYEMS